MPRRIALIGKPLGHSISPVFQQAALDYYALDALYEKWETDQEALGQALTDLRGFNLMGANVTVPYKETVIPLLDRMDNLAKAVGAVNTIVNREGELWGYSTDGEGFLRALRENAANDMRGRNALVLGAGGAARAIVMALLRARMVVTIVNRTWERARKLVEDLLPYAGPSQLKVLPYAVTTLAEAVSRSVLVVNCTSVGMLKTSQENSSPLPVDLISSQLFVFDIVANPLETVFLAEAKRRGAKTVNGLTMLVYQGAASFELWTGLPAPVEVMLRAATEAMGANTAATGGD